jgi:CRP/FNR family transcriptional regulator, cyclic AMP receptor protein
MERPGTDLRIEDALNYLPRKPLQEFPKGRAIYGAQQPSSKLYLVVSGLVKVSTAGKNGCQAVVRMVAPEGLFGEGALLGQVARREMAVALDAVKTMAWSVPEIRVQIDREPQLGIALIQYLVGQCQDLEDRIEDMALHRTPERVAISLMRLALSVGGAMPDGATRLPSLTHREIAEYVGTSREIVTFQMNRLRRLGLLRYSRSYIDVDLPALYAFMHSRGAKLPSRLRIP